jgi:hypothetical protein
MNGEEAYLRDVSSRLTGMDSRVKSDVIMELKAHIADLVRANGGNIQAAMMNLEPPADVAKRYKQLYGYGTPFKVLFILTAAALAVPTLPVLQIRGEEVMIPVLISLIFLSILVVLLFFVAVKAGRRVGLLAGLIACFTRLGVFGLLILAGGEDIVLQGGGVGLLVVVSFLLIFVGFIPGEAKARWTKPTGEI